MTPSALLELADRVERLDGPDREVDARIAGIDQTSLGCPVEWCEDIPAYTASLDAAMTLAPDEGDPLEVLSEALDTARDERDGVFFLPLHIVAAALRARAQETNP